MLYVLLSLKFKGLTSQCSQVLYFYTLTTSDERVIARWACVNLVLSHRRRRWAYIKSMQAQHISIIIGPVFFSFCDYIVYVTKIRTHIIDYI